MIILFGIAGSGKGTQSELLSKRLNAPMVTSGDILRQNRHNPQVKVAVESGVLVPDSILLPLLEKEFINIGADKNEFILDGSPRSLNQAKWLAEKIKKGELKLTGIIHIRLPKDQAVKRLKLRARHDDNQQAINKRLKFYEDSVLPGLEYLKGCGFEVIEVDGGRSIEDVAAQIQAALKV
ncbi:nucleoside monophosphate kinase [Candidatus Saccharibacteria bacterium]|nr:nucleoside monophosphate kinase [Candidatus Saccharibacteria bacterium]